MFVVHRICELSPGIIPRRFLEPISADADRSQNETGFAAFATAIELLIKKTDLSANDLLTAWYMAKHATVPVISDNNNNGTYGPKIQKMVGPALTSARPAPHGR